MYRVFSLGGGVVFYLEEMPFLFWSAALFYVTMAAALCSSALRQKLISVFTPLMPATQSHIAPLDSFRGMAALWVFAYHVWFFMTPMNDPMMRFEIIGQGRKGVMVFAVLSGFLVYRSIRNNCRSLTDISRYAMRRFLRIYPLYIATLIAGTVFITITGHNIENIKSSLPFFTDVFMLRIVGYPRFLSGPGWNFPAWSLYVEVVFYILLPFFMIVTGKRILVLSFVLYVLCACLSETLVHLAAFDMIQYFLIGIILCELIELEYVKKMGSVMSGFIFLAGMILFIMNVKHNCVFNNVFTLVWNMLSDLPSRDNLFTHVTLGVGTGLLLLGAIKFTPISRVMSMTLLRFVGIISFSTYMWQSLFLEVIMRETNINIYPDRGTLLSFIFIYLPAIIFYSSVSYAIIEKPFYKLKLRDRQNTFLPAYLKSSLVIRLSKLYT